ncbi:MAG: hypothetical protein ACKO2P_07760 [Planctomycetota bacterium]
MISPASIISMAGFGFMFSDLRNHGAAYLPLLRSMLFWGCCLFEFSLAAMPDEFEGLDEFVERPRQVKWEPTSPAKLFSDDSGNGPPDEGQRQPGGETEFPEWTPRLPDAGTPGGPSRQSTPQGLPDAAKTPPDFSDGGTESLSRRYDGTLFDQLEDEHRAAYEVYRSAESGWLWMPGCADDPGLVSLYSNAWQPRHNLNGERHRTTGGLDFAFSMHWLDGPGLLPLPPRLYDLTAAWQRRGELAGGLRYDVGLSAGLYTDFEDSVREGWRFPGHAVFMLPANSDMDLVLGADYLDRDDIAALPVAGISLRNVLLNDLRLDLVFPRPRISWLLNPRSRLYTAGALGGGTWDVEFPDSSGQLVTYRDYRLSLGLEQRQGEDGLTNLEVAWVFGRQLERRGDPAAVELNDAVLLIMTIRH